VSNGLTPCKPRPEPAALPFKPTLSGDGKLRVCVNQGGVKRMIEGPFEICVDRRALFTLRRRLEDVDFDKWNYGWIKIFAEPDIEVAPNTEPLPWAER
jgi:hypothetical protein